MISAMGKAMYFFFGTIYVKQKTYENSLNISLVPKMEVQNTYVSCM